MIGDTNKDGYIDSKEFRVIAETFDIPFHETEVTTETCFNSAAHGQMKLTRSY